MPNINDLSNNKPMNNIENAIFINEQIEMNNFQNMTDGINDPIHLVLGIVCCLCCFDVVQYYY